MTLVDWLLSPLITATLLGLILFHYRNLILTRLKASVAHEFNVELEKIRADHRKSEEAFRADLRTKEAQIDVLRSGALSGMVSRQAIFDQRRLQAVEQLWDGIEKLAPLKAASSMMATFDFEKSRKLAAQEPKVRDFFNQIGTGIGIQPDKFPKTDAHKARPFVSEIAWALFAAYQAILGHTVFQVHILKSGLDVDLIDEKYVPKLVKAALPWCATYIDQHGSAGYYNMLEPLEAELLKELRRMMAGEDSDRETVERAAKIMEEVKKVEEAASKRPTTATEHT